MGHVLFAIAAIAIIIWMDRRHQKWFYGFIKDAATLIRALVMVVVLGFVVWQIVKWSYVINHTVFIGDPNKSIFDQ